MTVDDDRLQQLLRAAFPPPVEQEPKHDLWRRVELHVEAPVRWSWLDLWVAAAAAVTLFFVPGSFLLIAYHL